jgi:outer membrane protein OmpU
MNNFKKIGMTALAASLVSTSAFAGELTASGSASITMEGWSGSKTNTSRGLSMGDSVTLSGSTELDNGMTVSMAFELDSDNPGTSSYDDKSVSISSDSLGTIKFSGHGGSTAASAIDATAAGDLWDNFDSTTTQYIGAAGTGVSAAPGGANSIFYTSPSMEGVSVTASYRPDGSNGTLGALSATAFAVSYTGVEGLSLHYGTADVETNAAGTTGDQTVMKASYAYGPVTVAYSQNDYDVGTVANDQETTSYNISYTVSESISIGYGTETIDDGDSTKVDAEYSGINASYTAGGMTISAAMIDAENVDGSTNATADGEYWSLGLAFAF